MLPIPYLNYILVKFKDRIVLFRFLTYFLFAKQGGTVMQNWAYLAFKLMQKVSLFLQTTGKRFLVLLVAILKYLNTSPSQKKSSVRK